MKVKCKAAYLQHENLGNDVNGVESDRPVEGHFIFLLTFYDTTSTEPMFQKEMDGIVA